MLLFHLCLSGLFSHKLAREKTLEKADGLSLWLHMNLEKYVAAAVERKICHISPAQDTKKYREDEGRRRRAVKVCRGLDPPSCCQASNELSAHSVVPLQAFAQRARGWQDGRAVAEP